MILLSAIGWMYKRHSIYKLVLETPGQSQKSVSWLYCSEGGLPNQVTNAFSSAGDPVRIWRGRSEDYWLCPFLLSLLTQKHLPRVKTSRKCLLTSCYFCNIVTFQSSVSRNVLFPLILSWVQRVMCQVYFWRLCSLCLQAVVLWRHLSIFVTRRWISSFFNKPKPTDLFHPTLGLVWHLGSEQTRLLLHRQQSSSAPLVSILVGLARCFTPGIHWVVF